MMMQMLQAGGMPLVVDDARRADEDNPRGYFEYERVKRLDVDAAWLSEADGKAVKIIHSLLPGLPLDRQYRVILMRRPMTEVLRSQRAMIERRGTHGSTLDDTILGAIFEKQLRRVESWLKAQPGMAVLDVSYIDALRQPAETASRVAAFIEVPLAVDEMVTAVDPALHRQRT